MLILYLEARGFTEPALSANSIDATLNARYHQFLHKTLVLHNNYLAVDNHVHKIAFTGVYNEFIDSIIRYMVAHKIPNTLATGYSDPAAAAWTSTVANGSTSFAVNALKAELWRLLFEKIGKTEFLRLVLGTTCFQLAHSGLYVQVFGKDAAKLYKTGVKAVTSQPFYSAGEVVPPSITALAKEILQSDKISKKDRKFLQMCDLILRKHSKCNYSGIFKTVLGPEYLMQLQHQVAPVDTHKVINYVMSVINRVFPNTVWGSSVNKSIIRKCIVQYILTGNKEIYALVVNTSRFSITSVRWLGGEKTTSVQDFTNRKELFTQYLNWFFNSYLRRIMCKQWHLVPQVIAFGHLHMEYYPSKGWHDATTKWLQEYKASFLYEASNVTDEASTNNKFVGSIKLLPKSDGFRMLCVPLKSNPLVVDADAKEMKFKYMNFMKRTIKPIQFLLSHRDKLRAQGLKNHHPRCSSANDVYEQLAVYRKKVNGRPVFCLKFDMAKCYDNIDHAELQKCIEGLFTPEKDNAVFYIRQYAEKFIYSKKNEKPTFRVEKESSIHNYDLINADESVNNPHHKSVIDRCVTTKFTSRDVKAFIDSYVTESAIMISKTSVKLFKRNKGVFQGFPIAATLCNIFYNRIVDNELVFLLDEEPASLFLRLADDFLFITTDVTQRQRVFDIVTSKRFERYGAFVNMQKTTWVDPTADPFVFVGLTIYPKNLEITRTLNELSSTMSNTLKSYPKTFSTLLWWFGSQMRNLMHVEIESLDAQVIYIQQVLDTLIRCLIRTSKRLEKAQQIPELELKVFGLTLLEKLMQKWTSLNDDSYNEILISTFESCFWKYRSNNLISILCNTLQHI